MVEQIPNFGNLTKALKIITFKSENCKMSHCPWL